MGNSSSDLDVWCTVAVDAGGRALAAMHSEIPQKAIPESLCWNWISNVWVLPGHRRMGLAKAILTNAFGNEDARVGATWALSSDRAGAEGNLYNDVGFTPILSGSHVMTRCPLADSVAATGTTGTYGVVARASDMGTIAMIMAQRHMNFAHDAPEFRFLPEPEEMVCERLQRGLGLGVLHFCSNEAGELLGWARWSDDGTAQVSIRPASDNSTSHAEGLSSFVEFGIALLVRRSGSQLEGEQMMTTNEGPNSARDSQQS